jgi:hypothetical protein
MPMDDDRTIDAARFAQHIPELTAREALSRTTRSIQIPDDETVVLSPASPEFGQAFVRVQATTFDDLQLLGLVPRGIAEEPLKRAIAADDDTAATVVRQAPPRDTECACHGGDAQATRVAYGRDLRLAYGRVRKSYHPALASLLSDHLGTRVTWDSPTAAIVRKNVTGALRQTPHMIALFEDITIGKNATLAVDPTLKTLYAGTIWIHRSGRLRQQGSYVKIWASAIRTYVDFASVVTNSAKVHAPWRLNS